MSTPNRRSGAMPALAFFPLIAVALAACATPKVATSGFLTSYDALQASDETGAVKVQSSSAQVLSGYSAVIIDAPVMTETRLSPAEATAITAALAEALNTEMARDRTIATDAAPATLRVRYAIVAVETSNVALNALTSTVIGPLDRGSLALEAEVVDSVSGERLAAMTWARGAKATNVLGAYAPTGNARALAPDFARRVAKLVSPDMPG